MKLRRILFLLTVIGAVIALVQRLMEEPDQNDIWKPADPLRPYGDREAT